MRPRLSPISTIPMPEGQTRFGFAFLSLWMLIAILLTPDKPTQLRISVGGVKFARSNSKFYKRAEALNFILGRIRIFRQGHWITQSFVKRCPTSGSDGSAPSLRMANQWLTSR